MDGFVTAAAVGCSGGEKGGGGGHGRLAPVECGWVRDGVLSPLVLMGELVAFGGGGGGGGGAVD